VAIPRNVFKVLSFAMQPPIRRTTCVSFTIRKSRFLRKGRHRSATRRWKG